ncbi:uncharacterized protein LOC131068892 [Cryptomeria japonica]|uniref:uncharacterized protein LOC131068892 n=1 Tax=Cryptomeria japonica TaxID=3369 RepID=UPI0025ABD986|nr:uncharacterized protein LOC131068892 [Cryptomeria japonica]
MEASIVELVNEAAKRKTKKSNVFTNKDNELMKRFPGLMVPRGHELTQMDDLENQRKDKFWQAPEKDWIKINFDGASLGNPGHARAACVAQNDQGLIVGKSVEYIGMTTNNVVEFRAALKAIELVKKLRVVKLYLEGDSLLVVNAIENKWVVNWQLEIWLSLILETLNGLVEYKISHIFEEGNGSANDLEKMLAAHKISFESLHIKA